MLILSDILKSEQKVITNNIREVFFDISYFENIKYKIRNYETGMYEFERCTELELIYYFIHRPKSLFYEIKQETKKEYISILLKFYQDVRTRFHSIRELNSFHMADYQEYLKDNYSKNYVAKINTIIRQFLKWLHSIGYLAEDITTEMISTEVRLQDQPLKELTMDEVRQLLAFYKDKYIGDYALIMTLVFTGLRVFELAKAKVGEIIAEEEKGERFYYLSCLRKGDSPDWVYIPDEVYHLLMEFRAYRGYTNNLLEEQETPLYPSPNPAKPFYTSSYLSSLATKLIRAALPEQTKVRPITCHSLRHAYAEILRHNGASKDEIQQALGHKDQRTTERYLSRLAKTENHAGKKIRISKYI